HRGRVQPQRSARDPTGGNGGRRGAPRPRHRPVAQGGDARTHPRPAARLAFHQDGDANVNAQMLAINEKLGFTYAWQSTLWQLPMADARKALAGAEAPRESLSTKT